MFGTMARVPRIVVPGEAHHVAQRGNNRQEVFFVDDDRHVYLEWLKEECEKHGLSVEAYCLMTNHVHLVARPQKESSLAQAVGRTHWRYTQYVNRMHGRSGHLWQNRFYSCALDDEHLWNALLYVEQNPVRAKLVRKPWRYQWSSAQAHIGGADTMELLDLDKWHKFIPADDWKNELTSSDNEKAFENLKNNTLKGRPLGSDSFLSKIETTIGRRVRALPVGRPKKKAIK